MEAVANNVINFCNKKIDTKKLLIVEDDDILVDIIKNFAQNFFDEIYHFESAEKASIFLQNKNHAFDAVLLDFFLPGENGDSIVNNLKKQTNGKLYLMSGDLETAKKSVNQEFFDGVLQKPLSLEVMHDIFSK